MHDRPPGQIIRQRREAAGLSQQDASNRAGLAISTWGLIERGVLDNPTMETSLAICRVLQCELADIWGWAQPGAETAAEGL